MARVLVLLESRAYEIVTRKRAIEHDEGVLHEAVVASTTQAVALCLAAVEAVLADSPNLQSTVPGSSGHIAL